MKKLKISKFEFQTQSQFSMRHSNFIYFSFFLCAFSSTFFESFVSRRARIFKQLESQILPIDGDNYNKQGTGDYIYYQTDDMKYSKVHDDHFGVSDTCGLLARQVQYCQWVEVQHSHSERVGNYTYTRYYYTYHKEWRHHQISSLFFHDRFYHNPSVPTIPEVSLRSSNIQAGAYSIHPNMTLSGPKNYYYPSEREIFAFEDSSAFGDFKYAGKGIFYSAHQRSTLEKILRIKHFFDLKSDLIDWCTPGDRRVWFEVWNPNTTTVIGVQSLQSIEPFTYDKYKIGSVISGNVPLGAAIKNNSSSFPTIMKWIFRIAIIIYFVCTASENRPDFGTVSGLIIFIAIINHLPLTINSGLVANIFLSLLAAGLILGLASNYINSLTKYD